MTVLGQGDYRKVLEEVDHMMVSGPEACMLA